MSMRSPHLSRSALRFLALLLPVVVLVLVLLMVVHQEAPEGGAPTSGTAPSEPPQALGFAASTTSPPADDEQPVAAFQTWLKQAPPALTAQERAQWTAQGVAAAQARRQRMARLIRENPQQAIAEGLSFAQWAALPEEVKPWVEKPFSAVASYEYYPVCTPPGTQRPAGTPDYVAAVTLGDGLRLEAFVYGQNLGLMSKKSLPVQGISLDGMAAIRDGALQRVDSSELGLFTPGQSVAGRSAATGAPVGAEAVHAVAGGKTYTFASTAELAAVTTQLARLDALPGKVAASSVLVLPDSTDPNGQIDLSAVQTFATEQASTWTETKKTLFLIRVNFTDNTAEPVTQAAAATEINGASSAMINAMSYGKTWVEGTVSANLYTMPKTAAYYSNSGNGLNSELIRDARNTFRNTKSGGDAAINIGPVDTTGNGDAGGLGSYDIVGVFFNSIGMVSGGVLYAGLAGGGNLWVQNANYTSLYTHEWGHNYGLGHASFWQTSDGSVTGSGSSVEYGDPFDVMGSGPAPQGHYHPQGKSKLNWLTSSQWTDATATGSGTYRIYREDSSATTGALRGLRVTKVAAAGSEEYYWIGYKPAFTSNAHLQRGAYLNWQQAGQTRCWLLDTTPTTSGDTSDAPVDLGRTYADATAGVYITPVAVGGSGADSYLDVTVNMGSFPGNAAPTAGSISGPSTVAARSSATFTISANDSNGDTLAYSWNAFDGTVNDNTSSHTHTWTVGGTYNLTVTVSDMKGGTINVSKTVTVTDPLDTWTQYSVGTTQDLQDIVWGKGRFVSAEYWGSVFESWDGTTWSAIGDPPNFDSQPRLAFGGNVFVMAGKIVNASAAQICWSSDGRIWNQASFPNGVPQVREVAYGGGQFLAVADSGVVLRSNDGKTWSLTTVGASPNFRHVAYDGSAWIAVAMNAAQSRPEVVWTSLDGSTWTQRSALGVDTFRVIGAGGVMYALGWYAGVMYSADHGITWQNAALPGTTRWTTYSMAISDDGAFFVTAEAMDESGTPYALLVSTDGTHWSRTTVNGGNTTVGGANALAFGFGRFITVENGGVTRASAAFHPTNTAPAVSFLSHPSTGIARQLVDFSASASDAENDTLVYAWDLGSQLAIQDGAETTPAFAFGGSYTLTLRVSDGRGGLSTLTQTINVSDPVRSFTQRSSGTTNSLNTLATNGSIVVAAGDGGVIRTSTDGITWTTRSVTEFATNMYFYGATWDGAKFILVGEDYNFSVSAWVGLVYTSADGITWTQRYRGTASSKQLYGVASSGSRTVAVGNNGAVLLSNDGISWSTGTVTGITSQTLDGIAWNGSVFAFTGYAGSNGGTVVFTSTDGSSWIDRSNGAGVASWQDLRTIAWLNDRFVASGWYSSLRSSTDGAQTFTTTRSVREENPAMSYGDGVYFTAGVNLDSSSADVDVLSLDGTNWYSFTAPTTSDRNAAVFFKHTFITAGAGGSIWQSGDTTPAQTFASWQTTNFPGGGAASLSTADADADGVANLIEYALVRDPKIAAGSNGAAGTGYAVVLSSRAWLHLDVPEPAVGDVVYTVQGSTSPGGTWTDLAKKAGPGAWTWQVGGTSRINLGTASGGRLPVEIGMPDSASGQPRYFLRLQVSKP